MTYYALRICDDQGELAVLAYETVKPTPLQIREKIAQYKGNEGLLEWSTDGWQTRSVASYRVGSGSLSGAPFAV